MIKSNIYKEILSAVCSVTEVSEEEIMSRSKREEIVDARHLFVAALASYGYYPEMIAARLKVSSRAVRGIIAGFQSRTNSSPCLRMCRDTVKSRMKGNGNIADN